MPPSRLVLALLGLLGLSSPVVADRPDFASLAHWIEQTGRATGQSSGTAVAVIADGEVVYEGYFGHADIRRGLPVDRNTAFYIASATKPFLALTALQQARAGRLRTDTTLAGMFPEIDFPFDAQAIELADLLSHQSGIDNPALVWATAYSGLHDARTRRRLVALSTREEGARRGLFRYGNVGYNIASVWMASELGESWQDQLQRLVLQPLSMDRTTTSVSTARAGGWPLALPYSIASPDKNEPLYLRKVDATMQAAGGLLSTAPDLARFLVAQMDPDGEGSTAAIPGDVIHRSQRTLVRIEDADYEDFSRQGYAWGWYEGPYKGERLLHHFGGFAGFHAHLSFMPERRWGLVILRNEDLLSPRLSTLIADFVYSELAGEADVGQRVGERFEGLWQWARGMDDAVAAQRETLAARPWQLSLQRSDYAGRYRHNLLGTVTVRVAPDGAMAFDWGQLRGVATAYTEPDHVRIEWVPNSGQVVRFEVADRAVLALDVAEMRFARVSD